MAAWIRRAGWAELFQTFLWNHLLRTLFPYTKFGQKPSTGAHFEHKLSGMERCAHKSATGIAYRTLMSENVR